MTQTSVFPKASDFKKKTLIYATILEIVPLYTTLLIFLLCQPLSSASTLSSKRFRSLPEDMIYNEFPGPERSRNIKKQQLSNLMQSNAETALGERRLDSKTRSKRYSDVTKRRIQRNRDRMLSSKKSSKLSSSSSYYYPYYASAYSSKGKGGTGKASSFYSNSKGGMVVPVLYISTTSVATSTSVDDRGTSSNEDEGSDDAIDHDDDETSDLFDFLEYSPRQPAALPTSSAPTASPSQFPSFVPSSSLAPSKSLTITPSARLSQQPSASLQPSQSQKPSLSPSGSFGPSASMLPSSSPSSSQNPTKSSSQPSTSFLPSTLPSSSPSIEPIVFGTATIKMKSQLFDSDSDNEEGETTQNLKDIFFIGDHG